MSTRRRLIRTTTEQSWLNESSQATLACGPASSNEPDPNALTSTVASLDDAANAHAFRNFTDGAMTRPTLSSWALPSMRKRSQNQKVANATTSACGLHAGAGENAGFGAELAAAGAVRMVTPDLDRTSTRTRP